MIARPLTLVQPVAEEDKENLHISRIAAMICAAACMAVAALCDLIFWVAGRSDANSVLRTLAGLATLAFTLAVLTVGARVFALASRPETTERQCNKEALLER